MGLMDSPWMGICQRTMRSFFFFSSRRRHTRLQGDWSSDVCSSDLVWNYAHIGNFRTFLFEDLLRRHLEWSGYDVFHVMNLTDVDDRTIKAAAAAGQRLADYTAPFIAAFYEDRDYLRIPPAHAYPRAAQAVPAVGRLLRRALGRGGAPRRGERPAGFSLRQVSR